VERGEDGDVNEHELPVDPDEDDLPPEIAEAQGPLTLTGTDEWHRRARERVERPSRADRSRSRFCRRSARCRRWRRLALLDPARPRVIAFPSWGSRVRSPSSAFFCACAVSVV